MALFFANGATFATWGVHIPTVKARFGLSEASLSLAMFMVAAGAISFSPARFPRSAAEVHET